MIQISLANDYENFWELLLLADPSRKVVGEYVNESEIYTASLNNEVVGVCVLTVESGAEIEVRNLAVIPEYQNKGIGRKLLNHAIEISKSRDLPLKICTANTSQKQVSLYKSVGFNVVNVVEGYFLEKYAEPLYENGSRCTDLVVLKICKKGITKHS